jgi:hypothetical protein
VGLLYVTWSLSCHYTQVLYSAGIRPPARPGSRNSGGRASDKETSDKDGSSSSTDNEELDVSEVDLRNDSEGDDEENGGQAEENEEDDGDDDDEDEDVVPASKGMAPLLVFFSCYTAAITDTPRAFDILLTTYTVFDKTGQTAKTDRDFLKKLVFITI